MNLVSGDYWPYRDDDPIPVSEDSDDDENDYPN